MKTRAEPKEKHCHSRHLIYSLYVSLKQWCPALTLEEHFPVDLSTNTWSAASLESVIIWFRCLFFFFCCGVKSTSIYILLICMPTRRFHFIKSYLINYIFKKKKNVHKNQTTALTFTFRHPMSLDCRIQLLLSQSSSFLVVDKQSCRVLFQLQALPSLGFRLQPGVLENRTKLNREMALRPGTKPALGISTKRHVGKVNLYRNNQYTINHFKRKSVNRSTDLFYVLNFT